MTDLSGTDIGTRVSLAAVARPGDTLIIAVPDGMTVGHAEQIRDSAQKYLPRITIVVVCGATALAVYRSDGGSTVEREDL